MITLEGLGTISEVLQALFCGIGLVNCLIRLKCLKINAKCTINRERKLKFSGEGYRVTGHLSEGSFVLNVVVQILKFDAKPNPKSNPNPNPNPSPNPNSNPNPNICLYVSDK